MDLIDALRRLRPAERRFAAGAYLFHRDDRVSLLHLVVDGEAQLVRHQAGGAALVLQRAGPGAIIAEASMFADRYHCDCIAVAPTRTLSVRRTAVRRRMTADPDFAEAWAAYLAHEVQATRQRAEILSLRTVAERLDAWIAARDGRPPVKGEWKKVASEIGTSPEALYRELARRRA